MKRKFLIVLLSLVCCFCLAFGLTACDSLQSVISGGNSSNSEQNNEQTGSTDDGSSGSNDDTEQSDDGQDGDEQDGNTEQSGDGETEDTEKSDDDAEDTKDEEKDLTPSEGLKYTLLSDNTYEVSGIGTCTDTDIVIPDTYNDLPVTSIGNQAFFNDTCESVTIPDSVTTIEVMAFCESSIKSVTIGNGVTKIGNTAFYLCYSLKSVSMGNNVNSIGRSAFRNCTSLTSITMSDSVTSIGDYAFNRCTSLKSITIGNGVTSIGEGVFLGCRSLENIEVSSDNMSYKSIDGNLYSYDGTILIQYAIGKKDSSFTIPNSVTYVSDGAIGYCYSLTSINVSSGNKSYKSIDGNLYSYNETELIQYAFGKTDSLFIVPDSVVSISYYAFCECKTIENIIIGSGLTSIKEYIFCNCTSLKSIVIPDNVTAIDDGAFDGCTSLSSIIMGSGIVSIGICAFYECSSLINIYYRGTEDEWNDIKIGLQNFALASATRYYYSESEPDYTDGYNYWHYVDNEVVVWVQKTEE